MADIWEKIKENFENATEKAIEIAKRAAEKTQEQAAVVTVKIEIMKIEKKITEKLAKMGSITYEMLKQGKAFEKTPALGKLSEEVKELEDKLNDFKKVLEKEKKGEEKNNE